MNWLVYHFASGQAFFSGIALVVLAAAASISASRAVRRAAVLTFCVGVMAIAVSSSAIPYWCYAVAIVATAAWAVSGLVEKWRRWSACAAIVAWAVAAAVELPYHFTPTFQPASARSLTVIGDSITAGLGDNDHSERWPAIFAREHHVEVCDLSHAGETAASALKRAQGRPITSPVVLLEIGGNDLLGSTSCAQFSKDLDALLAHVSAPQRQVLMFELPLPPFSHEFGRIQRSLARKYNVSLVPKRVLLSVLAAGDATVDSIHLSQAGHERMAASVWELVGPAFPARDDIKAAPR
jgi:acyl-CoA thioesterase-1